MTEQGFTITSTAFVPDAIIPAGFTCDGDNLSPHLQWIHPPEGTQSLALILDDPDAPNGTFTHWLLADIPAAADQLPEGKAKIGVPGRNDFQQDAYGGPCPPPNHGEHRYYFKLHALDVESLDLKPAFTREEMEKAMEGHVLEVTEVMGRYERKTG